MLKYAEENNMILLTRDNENGMHVEKINSMYSTIDEEEIFEIVLNKLVNFNLL